MVGTQLNPKEVLIGKFDRRQSTVSMLITSCHLGDGAMFDTRNKYGDSAAATGAGILIVVVIYLFSSII